MKASSVLDRKRAAYRLLSEVMDGAPESLEALEESMAALASHAKLVFGCCNNCAAIMLFDGHDVAKQLPQYRQGVKKAFKAALQEFKEYEQRLLYASNMRMFHVDDMPASVRKSFGEMSDRQFFEFWQGIGSSTYEKARPFIGSLQNKYRLSMEKHGMRDADRSAALITTLAGLRITEQIFDIFVEEAAKGNKLPPEFVRLVFGRLSMKRIGIEISTLFPEWSIEQTVFTNPDQTEYDIFMWSPDGAGPSMPWGRVRQFLSSDFLGVQNNWSGNWGQYKNDRADEIIKAIPLTTDEAELKALYTEAVEIYLTEVPSFSLMYRPSFFFAVNESVWTNYPEAGDEYNIPPACGTDGYGIRCLYELELVG